MPTALANFLNSPSYSVTLRDLAKIELQTQLVYAYPNALTTVLQYVLSPTKATWLSTFTLYDYVNLFSEVTNLTALTEAANLALKIDSVADIDTASSYFSGTLVSFPNTTARQKEYFKFLFLRSSKIPESVISRTGVSCLWYMLSPADLVIKVQILGNKITPLLYATPELV